MELKSRLNNGTLYLELFGELDEHTASYTKKLLDDELSKADCKQIILDLSQLSFMDSTGIGVLIGRYKKMKEKNIPIFLSNPSNHIDKILKMTAIYEIMPKIN